jgi:hypothetical protein
MEIIKHDGNFPVDAAAAADEILIAAIAFDGKTAIISQNDESCEHYILLQKVGIPGNNVDKYFRIVFDREGADWTFACPENYKNISDKTRRNAAFYKDGFAVISDFLTEIGYGGTDINIPKRYRRHLEMME